MYYNNSFILYNTSRVLNSGFRSKSSGFYVFDEIILRKKLQMFKL